MENIRMKLKIAHSLVQVCNLWKKVQVCFFLLVIPAIVSAQSVSFINTPSDARTGAMGNAGYTLSGSSFVTHHNSASVFFSDHQNSVAVSYMSWHPNAGNHSQVNAGAYWTGEKAGIALGYKHNALPDIERYDENGNSLGSFTPKENAIDLGVAIRVSEKFAVSSDIRYIGSDMGAETKGSSVAFNINSMYSANNLNLAFGVANIGSKINYGYDKYDLPAVVKAGAAYQHVFEKHCFTFSGEVDYQIKPTDYSGLTGGLGIEYLLNNTLALRAGYHASDQSKTGPSYGSLGAGVNFAGLNLNAAYWLAGPDNPVNKSFLISLAFNF